MNGTRNHPSRRPVLWAVILTVAIVALGLRVPALDLRPAHGDEANNAWKFRDLYQDNSYRYDPTEFHGPTLYYLTLPAAWLDQADDWQGFTMTTYRGVTVVLGLLLVVTLLVIADGVGVRAVLVAAVLTAVSPAMVFYSRYFIHEIFLVVFSFTAVAAGWRYARSRQVGWAIACGASLALMHATKETCVVVWGAMILALAAGVAWKREIRLSHVGWSAATAAFVSVAFFSSFFTNPRGPIDSVMTYVVYLQRAGASFHVHPWHYYLKTYLWFRTPPDWPWTELSIAFLAAVGAAAAVTRKGLDEQRLPLARFLTIYTLALWLAFSLIPYKTPWSMLTGWHAAILLAGVGGSVLWRAMRTPVGKVSLAALGLLGAGHLGYQAYLLNFSFHTDPRNPHVYAHPTPDVPLLIEKIDGLAASATLDRGVEGESVQVIWPQHDYWPLPWYLRGRDAEFFSYFPTTLAPIIVIPAQWEGPLMQELLLRFGAVSQSRYVPLFQRTLELRHGVPMAVFVKESLVNPPAKVRSP